MPSSPRLQPLLTTKIKTIIFGPAILMSFTTCVFAASKCEIKMGYKEGEKLPLINKAPNNEGGYKELYTIAANRIGCELTIIRMPKIRLHKLFRRGLVDFYPGASFTKDRSKYLHYIKNGFKTSEYGLTRFNIADIENYQQVQQFGLTWLHELGSHKLEHAQAVGAKTLAVNTISIDKVSVMLRQNRSIFFAVDKEIYDYYLKTHHTKDLASLGIRVHKNCCDGPDPMYLLFSKKSANYADKNNPKFDQNLPVSLINTKTVLKKGSIAYKFSEALKQMEEEGVTARIYQKYFN